MIPSITIFVRHTLACKYRDDETWKRCDCRKHLRWSNGGRQYRVSAKTPSWHQAEEEKRKLEEKFKAVGVPKAYRNRARLQMYVPENRWADIVWFDEE